MNLVSTAPIPDLKRSRASLRWWDPTWLASSPWRCLVALALLTLAFFFYGLNAGDLWRTETLRAIIGREFLQSGNWIVPRLYGHPLFTKPPGMYAAIALCSLPFGTVTDVSARLPSAFAATAMLFVSYWFFSRQIGRLGGLYMALLLPVSMFFLEKGSSAEIDMLHLFWTAASIILFFRAIEAHEDEAGERTGRDPFVWWLAAFVCFAAGVLTKWTTPAFFYLTAIPYLWKLGRLRLLWNWRHLVAGSLAAMICLAWAAAAVWSEGWEVFYATIKQEAMLRLAPGYNAKPYPWLEALIHPVKLLIVMLPASALALWAVRRGFGELWDARGRRLWIGLHCWVWPSMIFWSLTTEHGPRHAAPLFPALTGLAAMVCLAWTTGKLPWPKVRFRPNHLVLALVLVGLGMKVFYTEVVWAQRTANRRTREKGELLASLVPLDAILYIFSFKDEGVMFYYGREVLRVASPDDIPQDRFPAWAVVTPQELRRWRSPHRLEVVHRMTDAQGAPIVLIRIHPQP